MVSTETWLDVPGWETCYQVSDGGRVRSVDRVIYARNRRGDIAPRQLRGCMLRPGTLKNGYEMVSFTGPGRKRAYLYVHDLVLRAFVGPKPAGLEVCRFDGTRGNNNLKNLRYDTRSANAREAIAHRETRGWVRKTPEQLYAKAKDTRDQWRARRRAAGLPVT